MTEKEFAREFLSVWRSAPDAQSVAHEFGLSRKQVRAIERYFRKQGRKLKRLPWLNLFAGLPTEGPTPSLRRKPVFLAN